MGKRSKYPSFEKRIAAEEAAAQKKIDLAAKREQAKIDKAERDAARDANEGIGVGAALQRVADKHKSIEEGRETHVAAVAEYLKPYLRDLNALERAIMPFPANVQIPWADIESDVLDPTSPENIAEVGRRYGVDRKALYDMSKKRKWTKRRAVIMELHGRHSTVKAMAGTTHAMAGGDGEVGATVLQEEQMLLGLVHECLNQIKNALADRKIPFRSAGDIDKIVRLLLVVQGKADSIKENRNVLTQADMEKIASKVARNLKVPAAMAGIIIPVKDAEFEVKDEPVWDESEVAEKPAAPSV